MNVVYYCSDFFSEMCGVSIQSLCENNQELDLITVYVIEDGISEKNINRLKEIVSRFKRKIEFIKMPTQEECYPGVNINLGRTYARMAIGEILPQNVDRVLSLDSDTIVLDSLKKMYNTTFTDEQYVAGVYDCVGSAIQQKVLMVGKEVHYCNAGMFLIDLSKWRKLNVGKQLLDLVMKNADRKHTMYFLEQDLMNLAFSHHLKLLGPRYNMITSVYYFEYNDVLRMKRPVSYYSKKTVEKAKEKPALLHATTCFYIKKRMWVKNSDHPYHKIYLHYRNKTGWKKERLIEDKRAFKKVVYAEFWHCMPKKVAISLASILINYVRPLYARITTKLKISTIAKQSSM